MKAKSIYKQFEKIKEIYYLLRIEMKDKWNRDLPFEELLFDRWERAENLKFGKGANIYHNSYVYGDVKVGENTWIGPFTLIDGTGGLEIGNCCCISAGVHIYTHDTVNRFVSGGKEPTNYASVKIEDCCYIGPQSVIRAGISIGKHSIIGACSFVNKSIPPNSIAVGIPAKVIGRVDINESGQVDLFYN